MEFNSYETTARYVIQINEKQRCEMFLFFRYLNFVVQNVMQRLRRRKILAKLSGLKLIARLMARN